jgi:hypothetical protein
MGPGKTNHVQSGSKKTHNYSNYSKVPRINAAGWSQVPPLLTQTQHGEQRVAAQFGIAGKPQGGKPIDELDSLVHYRA